MEKLDKLIRINNWVKSGKCEGIIKYTDDLLSIYVSVNSKTDHFIVAIAKPSGLNEDKYYFSDVVEHLTKQYWSLVEFELNF